MAEAPCRPGWTSCRRSPSSRSTCQRRNVFTLHDNGNSTVASVAAVLDNQDFRVAPRLQVSQRLGCVESYDRKSVESLASGPTCALCPALCPRKLSRQVLLPILLREARPFRSRASPPPAEADLLRDTRAVAGVIRCHHGIVGRQPPLLPILLRCHSVVGLQVPLEHLQLLPVLQADDVVREHRFADRHGRRQRRWCWCWFGRAGRRQ